jgi:glycosyltransferase involved in cell wall biosynthesis
MIMKNSLKLKIAILYSGGQSLAGIEQYLINLFGSIDKSKFDIELLSLGDWKLTEQLAKNDEKINIFSAKRISIKTVVEIGRYCRQNEVKLLVSQGVISNIYARLVSIFYKVTNLVTVHSDLAADYSNVLIRSAYWSIDRLLRFATSRYVAVSEFIKSGLVRSGVSADKIDVIYNGSDFPKAGPRAHKRLVIGSLGRLHLVKGYDLLIRAFALMENKRLRLRIAGEGGEMAKLQQLAADLKVADRIELVGYKTDIFKFLDTVDVYVQPSRSEGFGLSVIAAMSQNLPVVVTPVGSLKELIVDCKNGFISDDLTPESLADAMSQAVENYELSKKVGENAREFVIKNFSIKDWIDNTTRVYNKEIK